MNNCAPVVLFCDCIFMFTAVSPLLLCVFVCVCVCVFVCGCIRRLYNNSGYRGSTPDEYIDVADAAEAPVLTTQLQVQANPAYQQHGDAGPAPLAGLYYEPAINPPNDGTASLYYHPAIAETAFGKSPDHHGLFSQKRRCRNSRV